MVHRISAPLAPKFNDLNERRKLVSNVRVAEKDEPQVSTAIRIDAFDEEQERVQEIVIPLSKQKERIEKEKMQLDVRPEHRESRRWKELCRSVVSLGTHTERWDIEPYLFEGKL